MEEEKIRQIIREEIGKHLKTDGFYFDKQLVIANGKNIKIGRSVGTQIGTEGGATGQKLGFFGTTPVVQLTTIADPSGGVTTDSQARASIVSIIDALQLIGLMQ